MVTPVFKDTNCDVCGSWETEELIKVRGAAYHKCTSCGLIYAQPMVDNVLEVNEELFSQRLDSYVQKAEQKARYRKKLRRFTPYRKTGNFLEIGCSTGGLLWVAKELGWNAKGVDISKAATAFARGELGLDVITGSVEDANYADDFFDAIYTNATLEHLRHPLATLKECSRILRPGGIFYAYTVNWDSYTRWLLGADWRYLVPAEHLHLYTPRNILSLCRRGGLEHVKTWTTGVRKTTNVPDSTFKTPWYWYLIKSPLSFLSRFNKKGDSIEFLARKPEVPVVSPPRRRQRGGRLRRALRKLLARVKERKSLREAQHRTVRHDDFSRAFAASEPLWIRGDGFLDGGISMLERLTIALLLRFQRPRRIVEIGTYCGVTTRLILDNAPDDAEIWTIDLPEVVRTAESLPNASDERLIHGRKLGTYYRNSPRASQVHQLLGDSQDRETWRQVPGGIEFALIDASHTYEAVKQDTFLLLEHLDEEAILLWHDYTRSITPERGVGKFLREQMSEWHDLFFLEGTSFGIRISRRVLREQAARVREYYVAGDYDVRRPQGAFPWLGI